MYRRQLHTLSVAGAAALVLLQAASAVAEPEITKKLDPVLNIAGGLRFESLQQLDGETAQARHPTVAVSQVGVRGVLGKHVYFESVFEANMGGPYGNGASVWEGQAQMSVLNQYVEYRRDGLGVAVGRLTDESTLNFLSMHSLGLLGRDFYIRNFVIYSGSDAGTGIRARYRMKNGLEAGLTVHSTNPTGLTGTFLIGGELFPYDRPFALAAAQVGRSQDTLPDQNLHVYFATPSLAYRDDYIEARAAVQVYQLDTQMSTTEDKPIDGFNVRAGVRGKLFGKRLFPFANISYNRNDMLDPMDATVMLSDKYRVYTLSGGLDYNFIPSAGVGVQYGQIMQKEGAARVRDHFVNVGSTYFIEDNLSVAVRLGWYVRDDSAQTDQFGNRSLFITGRMSL